MKVASVASMFLTEIVVSATYGAVMESEDQSEDSANL